MNTEQLLKERVEEVDLILMQLEDYTHGEDGDKVTQARRILQKLKSEIDFHNQELQESLNAEKAKKERLKGAAIELANKADDLNEKLMLVNQLEQELSRIGEVYVAVRDPKAG